MRAIKKTALAGVTLTELIVVLAIVSLLATLAVPVVINRAREARIAVARAEVQALAQGEEICGIEHGFYVPLQMLDNIPFVDTFRDGNRTDDIFNDIFPSDIQLISVDVNSSQQITNGQTQLNAGSSIAILLESDWKGPFAQPQRVFRNPGSTASSQVERFDHPLDPWGNAYRLYSPEGIVGSSAGADPNGTPATNAIMNTSSFSNGELTNTYDWFDRYAVVSFGPDGQSDGANLGEDDSDDIVYLFGTMVRRTDSLP